MNDDTFYKVKERFENSRSIVHDWSFFYRLTIEVSNYKNFGNLGNTNLLIQKIFKEMEYEKWLLANDYRDYQSRPVDKIYEISKINHNMKVIILDDWFYLTKKDLVLIKLLT